jgi:disulfide bond formation protein DsbB
MINARVAFAAGFVICAGLLGYAYYLQYVELQNPCPLCMVQRAAFYGVAVVFLLGALHGPRRRGIIVYAVLAFVIAALGAAVAARHVWLQNLPSHLVPVCGPGLEYMLKRFALADVVGKVLTGSGECAEAGWKFLGLTIAGWSLAWLVLMALFALLIAWKNLRGNVWR